jgi:hypothetical protein
VKTPIKYLFIWFILVMCIGFTAGAQKLPSVQEKSVLAPANIKIDGKATEWDNQFQAYNKSTSLYYTIANNKDNLYLLIQATDKTIIEKILAGGINLTISTLIGKSTPPVVFTLPFMSPIKRGPIVSKLRSPDFDITIGLAEINKEVSANFKEIGVSGISAIPDSTISVYNDYGIKMSGLFDANKAYTCELTIPLKYLNHVINAQGTFIYNIKLNGTKVSGMITVIDGKIADPSSPMVAELNRQFIIPPGTPMMELASTTDFTGTYTLVKK